MNIDAIKKKLDSFNSQSSNQNGERKNIFWKPSIGKQVVRVVPSKYNKDMPFTEMLFYYNIGARVMASPFNWKEKDPIMEFTKTLRQSSDKENWRLAKKLDAKTRIFAPIIVRGEEEDGVKLWQFGKEVYESFLQMATDEEIGDYTDVFEGRDIKLNTVGPESTGTPYNRTTVGPSLKTSPLSEDKDLVEKLLDQQPDPFKVFKRLSFDEVKSNLQSFLSPEEQSEGEISSEPVEKFDDEKKPNYSLNSAPTKQSNSDKFEDLFKDDNPF